MGTSLKNWQIAAILCVLLIGAGTMNRAMRAFRASSALAITPPAAPLADIPIALGPYVGRDVPLDSDVLRAANVDSFIHREYHDSISGKSLVLYVGFWGRENVGMGHGPEVCYPAAGWHVDAPVREMPLAFAFDDRELTTRMALHRFIRTEAMGIHRCAVGFLAAAQGEFFPTSRGMFWHAPGLHRPEGGHYLAQIHVSAYPSAENWEQAESDVTTFFKMMMPYVTQCMPGNQDLKSRKEEKATP